MLAPIIVRHSNRGKFQRYDVACHFACQKAIPHLNFVQPIKQYLKFIILRLPYGKSNATWVFLSMRSCIRLPTTSLCSSDKTAFAPAPACHLSPS